MGKFIACMKLSFKPVSRHCDFHVIYLLHCQLVPPTQLQAYQSLLEAERYSTTPSGDRSSIGNAQLVNIAINIEDDQ